VYQPQQQQQQKQTNKQTNKPMTSETYSTFTTGFGGGGGSTTTTATSSSSPTTAVVRRIRTPHPHDVLSGRGGGINAHPGNVVFREWVRVRKEDYNLAPNKAEKTRVATEVMDQVRQQDPPGRFLTRDTNVSHMGMGSGGGSWWVEIDENRALAKTSQALREGAPNIRSAHKDEIQQRKVQYAKEHPKPPKQHQQQQQGNSHSHSRRNHGGSSKATTNQQQQQSESQSARGGRRRRRSLTTTTATATGPTSRLTTSHKRKVSEAFPTTTTTATTTENNAGTAPPIVYGRGGGGSALTKRLAQGGGGGFTANTGTNSSNILWNTINNNNNNANVPGTTVNVAPAPSAAAAAVTTGIGGRGLPRRVIPATNYRAIEELQENARAAAAQQQQQQQQHHHRHHHHHRYGGAVVDGGADTPPLVPHPSPSIGAPTHQGRMEQLSIGEPRDDDVVLGFPKRNANTNGTGGLKRVHSLALSEFSFGNITENEMGESPTIDEEFVNPFADESDIGSRIAPAADPTSSSGVGSASDKASMLRNISSSGDDYNPGGVPSTPYTATDENTDQQSAPSF